MGTRGPAPKRSDQRRRRNNTGPEPQASPGAAKVAVPPVGRTWHPAAKRWYKSLADSGQSTFYEPSDWATASLVAESISRDLKEQFVGITADGEAVYAQRPIKGASLTAYLRAMAALLVTEGDRRRAGLELRRPDPGPEHDAGVTSLDEYRRRAIGG